MTKDDLLDLLKSIKQDLIKENNMLYKEPYDMTSEIRYNEGYISAIKYISKQIKELKEVR